MKEYMELHNHNGMIDAVMKDKTQKLGMDWATQKIAVLNDYAKKGWTVVGYNPHSILLVRESK